MHLYLFSSELVKCMPLPLPRPRCTKLSTSFHPNPVYLSNERINQYLQSFISYTGTLWTSLPLSVFPPVYDLNSFKREVLRHLSHKIGSRNHASIYPTVLFTGSGDKLDFLKPIFVCPWPVPFLCIHKKTCICVYV